MLLLLERERKIKEMIIKKKTSWKPDKDLLFPLNFKNKGQEEIKAQLLILTEIF